MTPFGARLSAALDQRVPVCIGIDPHAALLAAWGLPDDAAGVERFARTCLEAFGGRVAAFKPQSAFFERHGSAGVAVLERTLAAARDAGTLAVLDAKRGDIGSTMAAYAQAYLDPASPLAADALTVSPYLGVGALDPAFETADRHGAGLFVLAQTSNTQAPPIQSAVTAGGATVAGLIAAEVGAHNLDAHPLGSFGLVVGATIGSVGFDPGQLNGPLLVPGLGVQGGTAADVARLFGPAAAAVLASVSREVLAHGPDVGSLRAAGDAVGERLRRVRDTARSSW